MASPSQATAKRPDRLASSLVGLLAQVPRWGLPAYVRVFEKAPSGHSVSLASTTGEAPITQRAAIAPATRGGAGWHASPEPEPAWPKLVSPPSPPLAGFSSAPAAPGAPATELDMPPTACMVLPPPDCPERAASPWL